MGERLQEIKARIQRGYVFDRPGEVVVAPEWDVAWMVTRIEALERDRDKLALFIRGNCYKHGRGDDACSCEWLEETLREAE